MRNHGAANYPGKMETTIPAHGPSFSQRGTALGVFILVNHDPAEAFKIEVGDRIAQLVIQEVGPIEWDEVDDLGQTARGQGGFGSTGRQ